MLPKKKKKEKKEMKTKWPHITSSLCQVAKALTNGKLKTNSL
jgi:hypothetical protein